MLLGSQAAALADGPDHPYARLALLPCAKFAARASRLWAVRPSGNPGPGLEAFDASACKADARLRGVLEGEFF